jgi:hypothetical protein
VQGQVAEAILNIRANLNQLMFMNQAVAIFTKDKILSFKLVVGGKFRLFLFPGQ